MTFISEVKRRLREHPISRDAYAAAAGSFHRLRISVIERLHGRYYTAARLDRIFTKQPDPWSYLVDASSRERKELILQLLPKGHYPRLLEVGCAEGWMSDALAERADELVCVDISGVAIERARKRCAAFPEVRFVQMDLAREAPIGPFDAIICAGVLVLLPQIVQLRVRDALVAALRPGGDLVLENQTDAYPGQLAGESVDSGFRAHHDLAILHHRRMADYAVTVFRRI